MDHQQLQDMVEPDVRKAFIVLAAAAGVPVSEADMPHVGTPDKKDSPSYDFKTRCIKIPAGFTGDGIAYFEESSHALRHLAQARAGVDHEHQDYQVHEFFGRIGETIGRHATRGTDLERLFDSRPPRDMRDPETRKRWLERIRKARKLRSKIHILYKSAMNGRDYLREATHGSYRKAQGLVASAERGEIGLDEFAAGMRGLRAEYTESMKRFNEDLNLGLFEIDAIQTRSYINTLDYMDCSMFADAPNDEKKAILANHIEHFRTFCGPGSFRFDHMDARYLAVGLLTSINILNHNTHSRPYLYGQQYSARELLAVPNLYSMPDPEVRDRFFRIRRD